MATLPAGLQRLATNVFNLFMEYMRWPAGLRNLWSLFSQSTEQVNLPADLQDLSTSLLPLRWLLRRALRLRGRRPLCRAPRSYLATESW